MASECRRDIGSRLCRYAEEGLGAEADTEGCFDREFAFYFMTLRAFVASDANVSSLPMLLSLIIFLFPSLDHILPSYTPEPGLCVELISRRSPPRGL